MGDMEFVYLMSLLRLRLYRVFQEESAIRRENVP